MENGAELAGAGLSVGLILFFVVLGMGLAILNGIALWKAARRGSKGWFLILFLTNTIVLELLYIFVFSKEQNETVADHSPPQLPASN